MAALINKTLHTKRDDGATHWRPRVLAAETGIGKSTVARYLKALRLEPHRLDSSRRSTDPLFIEKRRDVVGLDLDPPDNALDL